LWEAPSAFLPGRGEEFFDLAVEAVGVFAGGLEQFHLAGGEAIDGIFKEEVNRHLDGSHGGFELVGEAGEDALAGLVDAFFVGDIKEDDGDYVLFGDLSINGVTRQVEFALEFEGVNGDPWGGTRVAFSAETEINRKDFGLEWNVALETGGVLVSDKVKVQLDIQAVKA